MKYVEKCIKSAFHIQSVSKYIQLTQYLYNSRYFVAVFFIPQFCGHFCIFKYPLVDNQYQVAGLTKKDFCMTFLIQQKELFLWLFCLPLIILIGDNSRSTHVGDVCAHPGKFSQTFVEAVAGYL
jgi:hypothetical protein